MAGDRRMETLFINGKFCAQRLTGVQRYAREMIVALDREWRGEPKPMLLLPPGASPPSLRCIATCTIGSPMWPLTLWEQVALPWHARSGVLLNLSGSAPAWARRRVATMHDAAVFDCPESYTVAFRLWYRWLFRRCASRDDVVVTVSEFSRRRLAAVLRRDPSRLLVIPGAGEHMAHVRPSAEALRRLGLVPHRYWLCVASANPSKGVDLLLQAWVRGGLGASGAKLVLVGGRDHKVFAGAALAPLPDGVVHAGTCSDGDLAALMAAAFALVMPSRYEGFGLPMLEAMTLGCAVVATRAGALPEVGADAALWTRPNDATALCDAMVGLWRDAELWRRLREAGRRQAARFGWGTSARSLLPCLTAPVPADDGGS